MGWGWGCLRFWLFGDFECGLRVACGQRFASVDVCSLGSALVEANVKKAAKHEVFLWVLSVMLAFLMMGRWCEKE